MRILFVHQNFPAQYRYVAATLAREGRADVVALGDTAAIGGRAPLPGVRTVGYDWHVPSGPFGHPFAQPFDKAVTRGQVVAHACRVLRTRGFVPDVIYAHPGWGEALFLRDEFPDARITLYCEFFYRAHGADVGFDAEFPAKSDDALRVRAKNAAVLLSMEAADGGISPTAWQRRVHPDAFHERIRVIHDGIDTDYFSPDPQAALELPGGATLTARDEVVTYVARNLEPHRGFHTFMRALPRLQALRPSAHVVIVGGDDVSYGNPAPGGATYREWLLAQIDGSIDPSRVHFLGKVPYATLRQVYRVSSAHVYLTYPFVLSWSVLEAMSCGCAVIGSATAPVAEVIVDGENGRLVDFFDSAKLADEIATVLDTDAREMRERARATVLERYDLTRVCLPAQLDALGR